MLKFEYLTQIWIDLAMNFAAKDELESLVNKQSELASNIYEYLEPIKSRFLETVTGRSIHYDSDLSWAVNINRLLKSKDLQQLSHDTSNKLIGIIDETFSLGMLTQLFIMYFPTRDKYSFVDLELVENEWILDAVAADAVMGYYGDRNNPICMNIWELHYQNSVHNFLKKEIRMNAFKMGKFKSFFRNLYLAGALLVMKCELETKKYRNISDPNQSGK